MGAAPLGGRGVRLDGECGLDAELRCYLAGTSDRVLVQASPADRIGGMGLATDAERPEG